MTKLKLFCFLCGMIFMTGTLSARTSQSIIIKGKVTNTAGKPIVYFRTVGGIYVQSKDTLQVLPDSTFTVTLPADSPEKVDFTLWRARRLGSVYLKPGVTKMDIDAGSDTPLKVVATPENKTMNKLAELDDAVWDLRARRGDKWNIARDTVAASVYDKLTAYALSMEKELVGVDKSFKSKAVQDIRMQLLLAFSNQYLGTTHRSSASTKKEWNDTFYRMVEFARINHPDNVFSSAFAEAVNYQYGIKAFQINPPANPPKDRNELNKQCFDEYVNSLQGKVLEVALADIILKDYWEQDYSTGISELYDRFVALYPQSSLLPFLNKAVETNKAFNCAAFSGDIHFIDSDSIQTFKELTDRYPGKVIFVDIWATWCSPCRQSFAYVKPLQQYAKEHDVVLLYITIDRLKDKDKWQKMANHYKLAGDHIIVNDSLDKDIRSIFGKDGALYIPHCGIVNTKGELQYRKAASPEDMDKLAAQLKAAAQ